MIQGIERFSEINKNLQTKLFFKPVRILSINCNRASIVAEINLLISFKVVEKVIISIICAWFKVLENPSSSEFFFF